MLVLTQKQVEELEGFIQELPGKYCIPTLNLFRKFAQENAEAQKAEAQPEAAVKSNGVEVEAE